MTVLTVKSEQSYAWLARTTRRARQAEVSPACRPRTTSRAPGWRTGPLIGLLSQRFPWFVDYWGGHEEFACVVAYQGGEPVGFTYGAPGEPGREWWREYLTEEPADPSTFSVSELMLRPAWRKQGLGERLHTALLTGRPEALAVLTVDTKRPRLKAMYEGWGYRKIGERQPFPDSPLYAVMLLDRKHTA